MTASRLSYCCVVNSQNTPLCIGRVGGRIFTNRLFSPLTAHSPSAPLRATVTAHWERPHASFEPWLAQEEKLSYRESLRDSKLSTSCLPKLFKEAASFFPSFCPSTSFRQFSFSNKSTLLLLNLLRDSREILDNLFWESSFVSSVCFNFCNKRGKY